MSRGLPTIASEDAGFSASKLSRLGAWLDKIAEDRPYHLAVARDGRVVCAWSRGVEASQRQPQASVAKSFYSCMLGIAVAESWIKSLDARVVDTYPEMMEVGEGEGPKPGRHAFAKDREITFRQLICNCSGYMKPGESPGRVFHYQTFGMNVLTRALARAYGLSDMDGPEGRLPACGRLIEDRIRNPIGATWTYACQNFDLPEAARIDVFGNGTAILASTEDLLRIGTLWMRFGRWGETQVVPEDYLRQATVTNRFILENEPEQNWRYGHGFWCNDHGKLWPDCPTTSFAAAGAGAKHVWVCPPLRLVVVQNPGLSDQFRADVERERAVQNETIARILDTLA